MELLDELSSPLLRNPSFLDACKKVRAVFFDLDGTLIDSEHFYFEVMRDWLKQHLGLHITLADYVYYDLTLDDQLISHLLDSNPQVLKRDGRTEKEIRATIMRKALELFPALVASENSARNAAAVRNFRQKTALCLALVSCSAQPAVQPFIDHYHLNQIFDAVLTGEQVSRLKPEPDIYLLALERLGLQPDEVLVIEDAPRGITAARAAGLAVLRPTAFLLQHEAIEDIYDCVDVPSALNAIQTALSPNNQKGSNPT